MEGTEMTAQAWHTLTPEQQHAEWARFHAAQQAAPPRRRRSWPWLAAALAGAAVVGAAVIATDAANTTTINGTMTVFDSTSAVFTTNGSCVTYGGFREIGAGTTVTVTDQSGDIVATGTLGAGQAQGSSCVFAYTIPDVPRSDFYEIEIARRGALTYSQAEVDTGNVRQELRSQY